MDSSRTPRHHLRNISGCKCLIRWSGRRDLNPGPLAPQATQINHLHTIITENKRLPFDRFGRQMNPRYGDRRVWTPSGLHGDIPARFCTMPFESHGQIRCHNRVSHSRSDLRWRCRPGRRSRAGYPPLRWLERPGKIPAKRSEPIESNPDSDSKSNNVDLDVVEP
jgi:hypothetical protein